MKFRRPVAPRLRRRGRMHVLAAALAVIAGAGALAGCGGSGGDAQALLKQTFSGSHKLTSGQVNLSVTLTPSGSAILSTPIVLSLGGPFQTRGTGQLPASNFTIQLSALGHKGVLNVISTGTAGYVQIQGTGYQLPASTFRQLASSFAGLTSPGGSGSGASALSRLGINPLGWLQNPSVVGDETIDGNDTKHIRAGINTQALLRDIENFATHSAIPGAGKVALSSATLSRIAASIRSPTLDVWTGSSDHTARKIEVQLTVPVSGQISTQLGGLNSLGIDFTVAYSALNQPQTIQAPGNLQPYSQFQARVRSIIGQVSSALRLLGQGGSSSASGASGSSSATGATGSTGTAGASGTGSSGSSSIASPPAYSQCIINAHGDVGKMQACSSLLGNSG